MSSQVAHTTVAYPGFCSIKRLGIFLSPLPAGRVTPPAIVLRYTCVERGITRVKYLDQEHSTVIPARAQTLRPLDLEEFLSIILYITQTIASIHSFLQERFFLSYWFGGMLSL